MHLYTHGIHIPGFPHSDLHAQWSKLESMDIHRFHKKRHSPVSGNPPDPKTVPFLGDTCVLSEMTWSRHPNLSTFLGVAKEGKKLTEVPGAVNLSYWRVNWKKANRQPWTPWIPGITYKTPTPAKETPKESTRKKHKHHERSRSRSVSSVSSDSSADKDKRKRSRERREKRRQKITVTIQIAIKKKAQCKQRKAGCHPATHTLGTPNSIHPRISTPPPPSLHKHIKLRDMHHRPRRMVLMGKDGEGNPNGTSNPLSKNMDPSPFPPEISVHVIRRYLSAQPKQGEQWGICFEGTECIRHTEPPLDLLTLTNALPSMMHVQYITTDTVLSPLLSQSAEQIFICQVKGHATAMAISKHMRYGPVMLPEKHSILLHNAFFARHTLHIRPTSRENQTLLYANFKMKTIKTFLGKTIQIPARIRDVLHRFTAHIPLSTQTTSEPEICQPRFTGTLFEYPSLCAI